MVSFFIYVIVQSFFYIRNYCTPIWTRAILPLLGINNFEISIKPSSEISINPAETFTSYNLYCQWILMQHTYGIFLCKSEIFDLADSQPQSTHRVAIAAFWRTFRHDGKISRGWLGWGLHVHPLSLYHHHLQSCGVRSNWEGRYALPISTLPLYVFCARNLPNLQVYMQNVYNCTALMSFQRRWVWWFILIECCHYIWEILIAC